MILFAQPFQLLRTQLRKALQEKAMCQVITSSGCFPLEHMTILKIPEPLRALGTDGNLQGFTCFEDFLRASLVLQLSLRFHSSADFGFLVCMGVILDIGNAIWEHEVGMRPGLPALGRGGGQCLLLWLPLLLVLHQHPQHRRAHIALCQV